jgi:hypothetical protein
MINEVKLTATYHLLDFNKLSPDKFSEMCLWFVDESGEYKHVEYYDAKGDKQRDVIAHTHEGELDYYQCKRQKEVNFSDLKGELEQLYAHIKNGEIRKPRTIYFVLSTSASPDAKDKIKKYAVGLGFSEPIFWEPVILDKKIKKYPEAKKNFFNISEEREEKVPQVDITGNVAYGTDDYRVAVVNNGDTTAIDCNIYLIGFGLQYKTPSTVDLKPQEQKEIRLGVPGDFMKLHPVKELRIRFEYRDSKNNWYYSERYLEPELVPSHAFYRIYEKPGRFHPAIVLHDSKIRHISDPYVPPGNFNTEVVVDIELDGEIKKVKIGMSPGLPRVFEFSNDDEVKAPYYELVQRIVRNMLQEGNLHDVLLNIEDLPKGSNLSGFEAYKALRDSFDR